jgi:hypothetical protein
MSGDHAKREIGTGGDKYASSERTHSRESAHKHKEESSSSIKTQQKGDKIEEENEESGLLQDRLFVTFHLQPRIVIRHF